ncbi:FxDxF family PEP-CTERM protein [Massilia sp. GCM10023247]|uniref:FxDxF family PEP-CTERM protein n=1 Tax=Massilia sp. GCM10023247 TaxID=3252643 RepID=UPI00361B5640
MKRQALLLGAVFSALLCGAGASAQTIARTTALDAGADGKGGFSVFFGDGFTAADSGRAFASVFTFKVAGIPFDAAASVTSSYLDSPATRDLRITGLSLYRYDPATLAVLGNAVAGVDLTGFGPNPVDSWSVTAFDLPVGSYAVRVDGRVAGNAGGSFGGDLNVSPVPEAPLYALLLAGLAGGALVLAKKNRPADLAGGRFLVA